MGLESGNTGICLYISATACRPSFSWSALDILAEPGFGNCGAPGETLDAGIARRSRQSRTLACRENRMSCMEVPLYELRACELRVITRMPQDRIRRCQTSASFEKRRPRSDFLTGLSDFSLDLG